VLSSPLSLLSLSLSLSLVAEERDRSKSLANQLEQSKFNPRDGGFLEKRGKLHKSFQTRFFRLQGQNLNYYKSGSMRSLKGSIDCSQSRIYILERDADGKCCFEIEVPGRTFKIRAASEKILEGWVGAFKSELGADRVSVR
jgi:hypothetical protein